MLYFSELKGKKVFTEDNIFIGKLKDIIFLASDNPLTTKLVVKAKKEPELIIPFDYLKKINGNIIISKNFQTSELSENELFLVSNLLDNQIIDISGDKIVRVNDVAIQDKPGYYIAGVDIGVLGILRWLGVENFIIRALIKLGVRLKSNFLSWADVYPLELTRGHVKIKKEQTKLEKVRPEDLADYLEKTNILNARGVLNVLDEKKAAEVISNLNINYQTELFKQFSSEKAAKILSSIDPEEAVDVLLTLSKKRREKVMSYLSGETYKEMSYLLNLSKTPVGKVLRTEFLAADPYLRAKEVVEKVKKETGDFYSLYYIYVVNKDGQLVGVFSLHELLLQNPETQAYKFMVQNLSVIHLSTPEIIVIRKMVKYKLQSLPVVDNEKHIVGVVTFDDVIVSFLKNYE